MNATGDIYNDAEWVSDIRISREMANETTDTDTLIYWFECLDERVVQMKSFMSSLRDAEIDDEGYFRRTGGALAFAKMSSTWVERRLLALGVTPPYPPNDPRNRQITSMQESIRKLKVQVAELVRDKELRDSGSDPEGEAGTAPSEGSQSGTRDSAGIAQPGPVL